MTAGLGDAFDEDSMTNPPPPALLLFRADLRLADNRALHAAVATGAPVLAVYLHDRAEAQRGAAALWWRHMSLVQLSDCLRARGITLILRRGEGRDVVPALIAGGTSGVFWNRRYSPVAIAADTELKTMLHAAGIPAHSCGGQLLHEPWRLRTGGGTAYRVYTPFRNALLAGPPPHPPLPAPDIIRPYTAPVLSEPLDALIPLPRPDWAGGLRDAWQPGEAGAQDALTEFLDTALNDYTERRDLPGVAGTSRLSPHLAQGEITPGQILAALAGAASTAGPQPGSATFRNELIWREFSYHLLFHRPDLAQANYNPAFDAFPWRDDPEMLRAWQTGRTGYPIVDAGMRELWQTGWMHNRVRMIVASFLTKHLLIDWRRGEEWFADTLVDADSASNPASWQWVAGSGADAAPYFRMFSPELQSRKFDAAGQYLRHWLPELAALPDRHIHAPWQAPTAVLRQAGVIIGKTWPAPVIDHAAARNRALTAWQMIR